MLLQSMGNVVYAAIAFFRRNPNFNFFFSFSTRFRCVTEHVSIHDKTLFEKEKKNFVRTKTKTHKMNDEWSRVAPVINEFDSFVNLSMEQSKNNANILCMRLKILNLIKWKLLSHWQNCFRFDVDDRLWRQRKSLLHIHDQKAHDKTIATGVKIPQRWRQNLIQKIDDQNKQKQFWLNKLHGIQPFSSILSVAGRTVRFDFYFKSSLFHLLALSVTSISMWSQTKLSSNQVNLFLWMAKNEKWNNCSSNFRWPRLNNGCYNCFFFSFLFLHLPSVKQII